MGYVCCDWGVLCYWDICAVVKFFLLVVVSGVFLMGLICIGNLGHFRNNYGHDDYEYQF